MIKEVYGYGTDISSISSGTDFAENLTYKFDVACLATKHEMWGRSNDQGGIWVWN